MNWFKVHHGIPLDARLAVIAHRTGMKRGEVLALWITLLDHAGRNMPKGSLAEIDIEQISVILELDDSAVKKALDTFREKKMISPDNTLADWEKIQPPPSTRRVQAFRHRQSILTASAKPNYRPSTPVSTPPISKKEPLDEDSPETIAKRRQRLRDETLAKYKTKGRNIVEDFPV